MASKGRGVVTLRDGTEVREKDLQVIKDKAKRLYIEERFTPNKISQILGPSHVTIGNWAKKGKWKDVIKKAENKKESALLRKLATEVKSPNEIDQEYVLGGLRDLALNAGSETVQLGAWRSLGDYLNMFKHEDGNKLVQDEIVFAISDSESDTPVPKEQDKEDPRDILNAEKAEDTIDLETVDDKTPDKVPTPVLSGSHGANK